MDGIVKEANQAHMELWAELLQNRQMPRSVLSAYIDKDQLAGCPISLSGAKAAATGWEPKAPQLTAESLIESIKYWQDQKQFPDWKAVPEAAPE
eukprot:NODE_16439_length_386_cov_15.922780_g16416_i0.p1 GENE.NODE_16439_length_386_cov_15.922780_g16416_i0~~NODE_16439_length_386_cov_15.922780_g16416_i0.p1  ORF type:complete len:109 (-),score=29.18 NODE_16439_length_386_cov_15.922780_g16416_i0:60-341(-)